MSAFVLPRVKVCGLTTAPDAVLAAAAGAEACGVVFQPLSPRSLDAGAARRIVEALPEGFPVIAVMVDRQAAEAAAWCAAAGVAALQLCGAESPRDYAGFPLPLLRRVGVAAGAEAEVEAWTGTAAGFVLDHPASPGGSGRTVDFELAARLARMAPCLLAGGLGPGNVAAAVAAVRPHGVDASSRLEADPGRKDPEAVRAFVRSARAALGMEILETS